MTLEHVLLRVGLPLKQPTFVMVTIVFIVLLRTAVILATPYSIYHPDPVIYQTTGRATLMGVNPYNFSDRPNVRHQLRVDAASRSAWVGSSQNLWDYYVSSNLPVSTMLYAVFEKIAHGSMLVWRFLFVLGDVGIFIGLVALARAIRGNVTRAADQVAIFVLSALHPSLILYGTIIPEDKQFETALMLFSAALILSWQPFRRWYEIAVGFLLSLSILFKLFGVFLLPLLARNVRNSPASVVRVAVGGLVPVLASFAIFGFYFVETMGARAARDSGGTALHSSPWTLLPWLDSFALLSTKILIVALLGVGLVALLLRRRIDLLNFCAGLCVIFACLWLQKGSLDRMNIAAMFGMASLMSLSSWRFCAIVLVNSVVGIIGYALGIMMTLNLATAVDPVLSTFFLGSYAVTLSTIDRRNHQVAHQQPVDPRTIKDKECPSF